MTIGLDSAVKDAPLRVLADGQDAVAAMLRIPLGALTTSYVPSRRAFTDTCAVDGEAVPTVGQGSLGRTSIVVMGLSRLPESMQRSVLDGWTAAELAADLVTRTVEISSLEELALVAWAAAETDCAATDQVLGRLVGALRTADSESTIGVAWALSALTAAWSWPYAPQAARYLRHLLVSALQGDRVFPRTVNGSRRLVTFATADQLFGIKALATYGHRCSDGEALRLATACAERVVSLQGSHGEWASRYAQGSDRPVDAAGYDSVHHYGLVPMALHELAWSGCSDHALAIQRGLRWVSHNPSVGSSLIDAVRGVIWRRVEPKSAARIPLQRVRPGGGRTRSTVAVDVDRTCRPEELGWLLYAWLGARRADVSVS